MNEIVIATLGLAALAVAAILMANALRAKKRISHHSTASMLRFARKAAEDVLSSNWDQSDYYSKLYVYASPELASHMQTNKGMFNRVLNERAELLGDYKEIRNLEMQAQGFSLIPSQVFQFCGVLHCVKGKVPLIILVNAGKDLTLDGIKIDKRSFESFPTA